MSSISLQLCLWRREDDIIDQLGCGSGHAETEHISTTTGTYQINKHTI